MGSPRLVIFSGNSRLIRADETCTGTALPVEGLVAMTGPLLHYLSRHDTSPLRVLPEEVIFPHHRCGMSGMTRFIQWQYDIAGWLGKEDERVLRRHPDE